MSSSGSLRAKLPAPNRPAQPAAAGQQSQKSAGSSAVSFQGQLIECSDPVVRDLIIMYDQQRQQKGLERFIVFPDLGDRHLFVKDDESILRGMEQFVRTTLEDSRKLNQDGKPKPAFFRRKKG